MTPWGWEFRIGESSSERLYDVLWTENLLNGEWLRLGTSRTGNGTGLLLSVTNRVDRAKGYYRTRVRLP